MKNRFLVTLLTTLVVVAVLSRPVAGQILLKPSGGNAMPLRTKSLDADVTIDRQFATTKTTLVFQNKMNARIEADFIYTLPPNTLVTRFAYWYGNEEVVARIVEKERASAIYGAITARMRDPALVEMIGKNTFRARIFPVMPNADLKVEMTFVQALPSTPEGALYTLPLRVETKTDALDSVNVAVGVRGGGGFEQVSNNYGLPVERDSEGFRLRLSGTNFRPEKDLRINLVRDPKPLQAAMLAAPSSPGGDGFFALALTPGGAFVRPIVRITGVRTYDVQADRPPALRAHRALFVVGRYKGGGPATVTLTDGAAPGRALRQGVQFETLAEPNNAASKLWAARHIAAMSARATNEAAVVALSKRFTLPSKFTSWLAVPAAEMERYRREKDMAEISVAAGQLADEIRRGRARSPRARLLRARLETLCPKVGMRPEDALRNYFGEAIYQASIALSRRIVNGDKNSAETRRLRAEFARLCRLTGANPENELRGMLQNVARQSLSGAAGRLVEQMLSEQPDQKEMDRLRARVATLARIARQDPKETVQGYLGGQLGETAFALVRERHKPAPDAARAARLEARLRRLEKESGRTTEAWIQGAENRFAQDAMRDVANQIQQELWYGRGEGEETARLRARLSQIAGQIGPAGADQYRQQYRGFLNIVANQLGEEMDAGREGGEKARALRRQIDDLAKQAAVEPAQALRESWQWRFQSLASTLAQEKRRGNPDETVIANHEQRIARLAQASGEDTARYTDPAERYYKTDPAAQARDALLTERRKPAPDPRRIAQLEARFKARAPSWKPTDYVRSQLERLAVEVELDKLEKVQGPPTPEITQRRTDLSKRWEELRARMGDPLIQVEAPPDAEQVIALLPDGTLKRLVWNPDAARWEARFDIPTYADEGAYAITVVIVGRDGARRTLTLRYHVDVTPPTANGRAEATAEGAPALRLEIEGSADTARAAALLPWGEQIVLRPAPGQPNRFFALVPVPPGQGARTATFVLTDRAHNRTTVTVDVAR